MFSSYSFYVAYIVAKSRYKQLFEVEGQKFETIRKSINKEKGAKINEKGNQ